MGSLEVKEMGDGGVVGTEEEVAHDLMGLAEKFEIADHHLLHALWKLRQKII